MCFVGAVYCPVEKFLCFQIVTNRKCKMTKMFIALFKNHETPKNNYLTTRGREPHHKWPFPSQIDLLGLPPEGFPPKTVQLRTPKVDKL